MINVELTKSELRQLQKQWRDEAGYVNVTVLLLLGKRRPLASIANCWGLLFCAGDVAALGFLLSW